MISLLPPNATEFERAAETPLREVFDLPVEIDLLWNATDCPESLLPFLAFALSVDVWEAAWPEHVKRSVISEATRVHRIKGTPGAMKAALSALDFGVYLSEWFEHGGDRFTFQVDVMVGSRGLTAEEFENITQTIEATKNARSHLSRLRVYLTTTSQAYYAAKTVDGEDVAVLPWQAISLYSYAVPSFAATSQIAETLETGSKTYV